MKKANVIPLLKVIAPIIKQELGKQGLYTMGYTLKSSRTGRITIEVKTCEFSPCAGETNDKIKTG